MHLLWNAPFRCVDVFLRRAYAKYSMNAHGFQVAVPTPKQEVHVWYEEVCSSVVVKTVPSEDKPLHVAALLIVWRCSSVNWNWMQPLIDLEAKHIINLITSSTRFGSWGRLVVPIILATWLSPWAIRSMEPICLILSRAWKNWYTIAFRAGVGTISWFGDTFSYCSISAANC